MLEYQAWPTCPVSSHFQTGTTLTFPSRVASSSQVTIVPESMDNSFMALCSDARFALKTHRVRSRLFYLFFRDKIEGQPVESGSEIRKIQVVRSRWEAGGLYLAGPDPGETASLACSRSPAW